MGPPLHSLPIVIRRGSLQLQLLGLLVLMAGCGMIYWSKVTPFNRGGFYQFVIFSAPWVLFFGVLMGLRTKTRLAADFVERSRHIYGFGFTKRVPTSEFAGVGIRSKGPGIPDFFKVMLIHCADDSRNFWIPPAFNYREALGFASRLASVLRLADVCEKKTGGVAETELKGRGRRILVGAAGLSHRSPLGDWDLKWEELGSWDIAYFPSASNHHSFTIRDVSGKTMPLDWRPLQWKGGKFYDLLYRMHGPPENERAEEIARRLR